MSYPVNHSFSCLMRFCACRCVENSKKGNSANAKKESKEKETCEEGDEASSKVNSSDQKTESSNGGNKARVFFPPAF